MNREQSRLAQKIATEFSALPQVVAVVLAGSQTNELADRLSDYDFYVYVTAEIPINIRTDIAKKFATRIEINNQSWEPGDEWIDKTTQFGIDVMYRSPAWVEQQLNSILVKHQASVGYSTCFWWNVLNSDPLYDRNGWFKQLQQTAAQLYPEALRHTIVAKNYPILRKNISAYTHQLESAINRRDCVSINHRIAALLASYFDIIFAVNYVPHPGEKRLVQFAQQLCRKLPETIETDIQNLLDYSSTSDNSKLHRINQLIDGLDQILLNEGLVTVSS